MDIQKHYKLDLDNLSKKSKHKVLLGTDAMCTPDADYSFTALILAVYDSHKMNYVESIELQVNPLIINRGDPIEYIDGIIFLNIPFTDLVSTDTRNPEKLARLYAAKLQVELINFHEELFNIQERAYLSKNLSQIRLEPQYSYCENNAYPTLTGIDWITGEIHKFLFAKLSELSLNINPVMDESIGQ